MGNLFPELKIVASFVGTLNYAKMKTCALSALLRVDTCLVAIIIINENLPVLSM